MSTLVSGCAAGHEQKTSTEPVAGRHEPGHHPHGEGDQRFDDPESWAEVFENPERDAWQQPERIIAGLDLAPTAVVAEIGSGTGYFAVRLARAVPKGRVWAIDVEPKMVRYLNERARKERLSALFSALGTYSDPLIPEPVDLILLANTYHHIEDRPVYLKALAGYLRSGGRVAIVEFKKGDLPLGPPDEMKLAPERVRTEFEAAGYQFVSSGDELEYHYTMIFSLPGGD